MQLFRMKRQTKEIPLLSTSNLEVGYKQKGSELSILSNLSLQIQPGQLITFIGPNGCGKSTLIRSLIGLLPKLSGSVFFKGQDVSHIRISERAQYIGVVLTDPVFERNMTVQELVTLGRYPHTNWLGKIHECDKEIITDAISQVGLNHKKQARLGELSDGERQRAMIARVLAQDVELIILDEPTAHLDLPNRMEILLLLKKLAHKFGKSILLSTHELGLALQVSDRVWIVGRNSQLLDEIPENLILSGELDNTFGNENISFQPWSASFELIATHEVTAYVKGMGLLQSCVVRLLKRLGYKVVYEPKKEQISFEINEELGEIKVNLDEDKTFRSLEDLQDYLLETNSEQLDKE